MSLLTEGLLIFLLFLLCVLSGLVIYKMLAGHFDRKPIHAEIALNTEAVADNNYTVMAARENAKAAEFHAQAEATRLRRAQREAPPG